MGSGFPPPGAPPYGQPPAPYGGVDPGTEATRKKAQNSLIVAIVGLICCAPLAILGLIWARQALDNYRMTPGAPGEGMAKAAQVISIVALALWAIGLVFTLLG